VIYRKLSFGNQSEQGARFVERMLSVAHTCRLQRRSLFHYLDDTLEARARSQPAPSLLPPRPAITPLLTREAKRLR
jgi:transposase